MRTQSILFFCIAGLSTMTLSSVLNARLANPSAPQEAKVAKYIGAEACRKCHVDQFKEWKKTKMASVFDVLKPGERAEEKTKAGLDPKKDYTRDETCLPCHVTGWGQPGGYEIPPEGDSIEARKAQKVAKSLEGVQCEACHGPGSLSAAHKKTDLQFKWADMESKGLLQGMLFPVEETCSTCHNEESPFADAGYVFDYAKRKDEGTHFHYRMDFDHACAHEHTVSKKKKKKKKKK